MKWIYLSLLFASSLALAKPKSWAPITDQERKICDLESYCYVTQKKDSLKFRIFFEVNKKNKMFWLKKVTISETGSKKTKSYKKLDNFQGLFPGERYKLYAMDLNGDDYLDLALEASRSLREGYFYFYWVYNPKKKEFVLTKNQFPELARGHKGKIISPANDKKYKITKKYRVREIR